MEIFTYEDLGVKRKRVKPIQYVVTEGGCHECVSHSRSKGGYIKISINDKSMNLHRYVYEQTFGSIPEGMVVMHKCDNPGCFNTAHLKLGTLQDNNADRDAKGRQRYLKGEDRYNSKLTEEQVRAIRADNSPHKVIAEHYGITQSSVSYIKSRKLWKHIE